MTPPNTPSSIYFDSNALIYVLTAGPGHEHVVEALELVRAGRLRGYISPLSYTEVRGFSNTEPYPPDRDRAALALLDSPSLVQVEFSRFVALEARRIAYTYGLKNPDAIHVASAVVAEAEVLFTSDKQLVGKGRVDGVWIAEPYELGDPKLFGN
ncbi:hypothetical protein Aph01nite_60820 [Acrocarpospora phusangensis]|uniref:Ribonuclease VapC n=1 Tax=Acrocarpospora phusangensis TaxID=1070424 RepID=A0A919QF32_9ACTN|nr:type II toxin-antitoxin system VapC family toxin [Acrocarpospora phusangensis]GIH27772.1 hypothetical protein Aph01nite_60820 [Acrocarpospora phusangensis]